MLGEFTYIVGSTEPDDKGNDVTVLQARDEAEALEKAQALLPSPSHAVLLPIQRVRKIISHAQSHGLSWLGGALFLIFIGTGGFMEDEESQYSFAEAVGTTVLMTLFVVAVIIGYNAILDVVCKRVGDRTLALRERLKPDAELRWNDFIAAYGRQRVQRTTRIVRICAGTGAALLVATAIVWIWSLARHY